MGSLKENLHTWSTHDWSRGGEEWSRVWGGTANLWWGTLFPRLAGFLPTDRTVEIAPGAGRFSAFLAEWSRQLILVDVTPTCVELCKARFADRRNVEVRLNDGRSLPGVEDASVSLVFSFDSLVHVDLSTIAQYLAEIRRVLAPGGVAFLHHSNFRRFLDPGTGEATIPNLHWRDPSVSASLISEQAEALGLRTLVQEEINWGCDDLIDAFTLLARADAFPGEPARRIENPAFMAEAEGIARRSSAWSPQGLDFGVAFDSRSKSTRPGFLSRWRKSDGK